MLCSTGEPQKLKKLPSVMNWAVMLWPQVQLTPQFERCATFTLSQPSCAWVRLATDPQLSCRFAQRSQKLAFRESPPAATHSRENFTGPVVSGSMAGMFSA